MECNKEGKREKYSQKNYRKSSSKEKYFQKRKEKRKFRKEQREKKWIPTCWTCKKKGHTANNCRQRKIVKNKINNLEIEEDIKNELNKIFDSEDSSDYDSEDSQSSEDCKDCCNKAESDNDMIYRLISQFQDNDLKEHDINVIDSNMLENILNKIKNPEEKLKILNILYQAEEKDTTNKKEPEGPYSMKYIQDTLNKKKENPSTSEDLKFEIIKLKGEITSLKNQSNNFEKRISNLENKNIHLGEASTSKTYSQILKNEDFPPLNKDDEFIQTIEKITSQKWLVKITLLINNSFKKELIALIDSGADLNCIREGLIPTKYFEKPLRF